MEQHADGNGDGDLYHAREDGGGVLFEHGSDNEAEDGEHDGERHEKDEQEQQPHALVEHAPGDVTDGLAVVAQADDERTEVVHRSNEDGTEHHPKQRRNPAPHDGNSRSDDGPSAGDGGEVVAEDNGLAGGHVINTVLEAFAGANGIGGESEDITTQPAAVSVVGHDEPDSGQQRD